MKLNDNVIRALGFKSFQHQGKLCGYDLESEDFTLTLHVCRKGKRLMYTFNGSLLNTPADLIKAIYETGLSHGANQLKAKIKDMFGIQ